MDKTQFKIAIGSFNQGRDVADRIARFILDNYELDEFDPEWFDRKVSDLIIGYDPKMVDVHDFTDAELFALLGAAIMYYDYDTELFFSVGSDSIIGHYIHDIAWSMKEGD